jgi:flotillin
MNQPYLPLVAVAGMVLVTVIFAAIWASRYFRVGPNRVLIVCGRQHQLADGTRRGFRIVRTGGTFVLPLIEKADALSLEALRIEMRKLRLPTAQALVTMDCLAQVKIKGDDASIVAAAEHFLSKSEEDVKKLVQPVLEKHLRNLLESLSPQELGQNLESYAARGQAAASPDLDKMGLGILSFQLQPKAGS